MWKWLWNWVMGRDWGRFEVYAGKSLDCHEIRNKDVKGDSDEGSEKKKKVSWRESFYLLKEYIIDPEQNVGRNMNIKCLRWKKVRSQI